MTEPTPTRIVISPHPLRSGYTVTSYAGQVSVIPAEDIERARVFAQQLAGTCNGGYRIIEETRLVYPLWVD